MQKPIITIGTGEMAGVFCRGFLKQGYPVYPVKRSTDRESMIREIRDPALVLLSVGEADLHSALESVPANWRDKLVLLQNELLPRDWQQHELEQPTVIAVWFEKKPGQDYKVLIPSPAFGPAAQVLKDALASLGIPVVTIATAAEMEYELVRKNVYILTTNITGLELPSGTDVEKMWLEHQKLAQEIAHEIMDVQFYLIDKELDRERLLEGMVEGIQGDLQHKCMGRSAPGRLQRAITHADEAGLKVEKLRAIAAKHG